MANANDKYFELWLSNEVDLARRHAATEQKAIDAKAAAEGWYKSGRRIIESIRLVAETCLPLADKAYAKASEHASSGHFELARQAVTALLDTLSSEIPSQIRRAFHPPHDRLLQEAQRRLQEVRDDFEANAEIERARLEAVEEENADRHTREREAAALERFSRLPRWGLLSVLAWIATRDCAKTFRASLPGVTFDRVNRVIAIERAWATAGGEASHMAQESIDDAWEMELAPALSDGKLVGSGSRVHCANIASVQHHETGLTFPTMDKPREADSLDLSRRSSEPVLAPRGSLIANEWIEWRDLAFPTVRVMELWPSRESAKPATQVLEAPFVINNIGNASRKAPPRGSPSIELALEAITALYPNGPPKGLRADKRNRAIREYCSGREPLPSDSSITRALKLFKSRS